MNGAPGYQYVEQLDPHRASGGRQTVVLSWGLGWDSTAILVQWLEEPRSRDVDLDQLVVLTAMTGDEFTKTGRLAEDFVLPLLRLYVVRLVQVPQGGAAEHGFVVLDDSKGRGSRLARRRRWGAPAWRGAVLRGTLERRSWLAVGNDGAPGVREKNVE